MNAEDKNIEGEQAPEEIEVVGVPKTTAEQVQELQEDLAEGGLPVVQNLDITDEQIEERKRVDDDIPKIENVKITEDLETYSTTLERSLAEAGKKGRLAEQLGLGRETEAEAVKAAAPGAAAEVAKGPARAEVAEKPKEKVPEIQEKAFDLVGEFLPPQVEADFQRMLADKIKEYLDPYENKVDKEGNKISEELFSALQLFLSTKIYETTKIIGIKDEETQKIKQQIKAEGKETVIQRFRLEIEDAKAEIEKKEDEINALEKELEGYPIPKREAGKVIKRRKKIERGLKILRGDRRNRKEAIRELERKITVTDQIAANIGRAKAKVRPETLLVYIHFFFEKTHDRDEALEAGKTKAEAIEIGQKKEGKLYQQAIELAKADRAQYKMQKLKKPGKLAYEGIYRIQFKEVISSIATEEILENFPEKERENAKEVILQLKSIDPQTPEGKEKLIRWINRLGRLLPKEKNEALLQNVVAEIMATLEVAMNKEKWRTGVSYKAIEKIVHLNAGIHQAYEKRLGEREEGDYADLMAKVEVFNRAAQEARNRVSPDFAAELRKEFSKNYWLNRAIRFVGGASWGKIKEKGGGFGEWGVEKVKEHKWKLGIGAVATTTGYIPAALTVYAGYKGGKALLPWAFKKVTGRELPKKSKEKSEEKSEEK